MSREQPRGPTHLPSIPRFDLLGVQVNAFEVRTLYDLVGSAIRSGERCVVANYNLHAVYLYHRDPKMRQFYAAAQFAFIDGMSLILAGRLLGLPLRPKHRMTSIDWLRPLLHRAAAERWRVFFLGSAPWVASRAVEMLRGQVPGLELEGHHGYFDSSADSAESRAVLGRIARYRPHLLCVGMGMPRQEHWIVDHLEQIDATVTLNLGAFMDYLVGEQAIPPRALSRVGLEWLARLAARPRVMWRRYLVEPWFLLPHLGRDLLGRWRGRPGRR